MEDDLQEAPKKRARRGSKKSSNGIAEGEPGGAQNADRKTRGSAKSSAPKKSKKQAKKPRSSVKASPATDWEDSSLPDLPSDSDLDISGPYGSESSDLEDNELAVKNPARKQRAQGVRLNDEFHSLNNSLIGFPEEKRTQARITYTQSELAIQSWQLRTEISSEYVALIAQSYAVLRAFSWQLRMAPFPMEALLVALATPQDSALRDEVHICMLRTLAWHDSTKLRAKRKLDFANLDHTTWKDFLWEFLRYAQQPAWWRAHVIHRAPEKPLVDLQTGDVRPAPPPCTLVDTPNAAEAPATTNGATAAVKTEQQPAASAATTEQQPAASAATTNGGQNGSQKNSAADGDKRPEWLQRMHHLHSADYYPQRISMRDYAELDPVERAKLLTFLTDVLLDQPHILGEIEHRVQANRLHAGKGGEGGSWPSKVYTQEELVARREMDGRGELVTEFAGCMLCLQEEGLVRCEACDARYHMSCLGYSSDPSGTWLCPECHIGGRGECAGARVPMAAMQPGRIPLYLMNGNVLRVAHPGQCHVEEDEDMVDCGLQFLQGDKAMEAMKISKRKGGDTGCHPSAPEPLVVQCSSAVLDDGGIQGESITPPWCTPWTYSNAYSWPEACAQLDLAVEDSRKQKRRGTPNAVVLAGMSMPAPFETPVHMPKSHVLLLHQLRREIRERAGLPALKAEVKDEEGVSEGAVMPFSKALSHAALNPPEGHVNQLEALRHYLLQVENQLWGVLDRGWTDGFEYRKRFLANILEARTPLLLARLLLVLVDAVRPAVAERIFTKEWSFMDVDLCPGGFAILDPAARAEAQRVEAQTAAAAETEEIPGAAYIGRTTARSAQAAAQAAAAAETAAAQGLDYACRADTRVRDRDRERERRRRRGQDDDAEPLEPFIATPFADDEVDEAPETGMVGVEPGPEFGRLVHELPPVNQEPGFEGAVSKRDLASGNKRKRSRTKRPTKAAVAAAVASASADGAATGPTGAAAVSAATGSALSQRRRFIMNLTEAKSIGKRPSPQFTNYSFFKSQAARVLPLERLPGQQVRQAGRQGGRVPIIGMVYPRQNTAHSAVARLGLTTLKWRGLLENAVSLSQVSIAFRHFEECLTLAKLDMAWLDEPCNAVLHSTRLLGRRMIIEKLPALPPAPDNGMEAPATAPPKLRTWQYLCACASPDNSFPPQADPNQPVAVSMSALQPGRAVWMSERALPLAFIKQQEEAARSAPEFQNVLQGEQDESHWLLGAPASGGFRGVPIPPNPRHIKGASRPAAYGSASGGAGGGSGAGYSDDDSGPMGGSRGASARETEEAMASRRSRRNVGRKTYYEVENDEEDLAGNGGGNGAFGRSNGAPAAAPADWEAAASGRPQRSAVSVQVGQMDAPDMGAGRRGVKPGPKRKSGVLQPWVPAALGAIDQLAKLELAAEFRLPVPKSLTWYHDIIKKPMDLSTVASKLSRGIYQSLGELQADVQRIWDNCKQFNEPESDIGIAGNHLLDFWRRIGSNDALLAACPAPSVSGGSAGAPQARQHVDGGAAAAVAGARAAWPSPSDNSEQAMPRQAPQPQQQQQHSGTVQDGRVGAAMGRPGMPAQVGGNTMRWTGVPVTQVAMGAPAHVPAAVDAALRNNPAGMTRPGAAQQMHPQQHPQQDAAQQMAQAQAHAAQAHAAQAAQAQIAIMARIVMQLQQSPHAGPFLEPVPREVEGYHAMIRHPMDLGTITTKLQRVLYPSVQHVHQDIMLMIQNCYTFNTEGSDIYVCAQHVEHAYRRLCTEGGLM